MSSTQADDAALGDGGALVDIMDAERQDGRAQQDHSDPFGGKPAQRMADFCWSVCFGIVYLLTVIYPVYHMASSGRKQSPQGPGMPARSLAIAARLSFAS